MEIVLEKWSLKIKIVTTLIRFVVTTIFFGLFETSESASSFLFRHYRTFHENSGKYLPMSLFVGK